ncbi:AAA family ATPase [Paenibacillus pasadenensis]|uniref:AAA family ATPase n=1 Tax=Paenibacillus pasadenensis TaxID=217090 RepID=UPI00203D0A9D|nr:ATP-binding protein [Paenibacillus pasadenensis]
MINDWNFYGVNGGEHSGPSSLQGASTVIAAMPASAASLMARTLMTGDYATGGRNSSEGAWNEHRQLLRMMRDLLQNRYGQDFMVYKDEDGLGFCWSQLAQDVKEGFDGLQLVARIYESMESRSVERHSADFRIYPSLDNHLFVYPEWKVALAQVPVPRLIGQAAIPYLFAPTDDSLRSFLHYSRERSRSIAANKLTLFTDRDDGLSRETFLAAPGSGSGFIKDPLWLELEENITQFFNSADGFYEQFGIPYRRGVLLYGKPGNGKTSLVRSLAAQSGVPAVCWQMTEHTSSDSIREIFSCAEELAPVVLIVEDLDGLNPALRSVFLNELDGMRTRKGIYLIATTNYPEQLDAALLGRPGRIDRAYEVQEPSLESREAYLSQKGIGRLIQPQELSLLAEQTAGFSYAQLGELYTSIVFALHEAGAGNLDTADIIKAIRMEMDKSRTGAWLTASGSARVGFYA